MRCLLFIPLFFLTFPLCSQALEKNYVDKVTSVYDGDTFRADISGFPDLIGKNMPVRINGIDTPEIRGKCPSEKKLAIEAKEYTALLLNNGQVIELKNIQRGKYFRLVADVYIDGKNLSHLLLARGLAYEYHGKSKRSWC